jgi:hypothetical protein
MLIFLSFIVILSVASATSELDDLQSITVSDEMRCSFEVFAEILLFRNNLPLLMVTLLMSI